MTGLNSGRFGSVRSKCTVMVLMLCFCAIALFGSPLHDHDLDLDSSHVDLDCISCHLVHANIGLDHDEPDLFSVTQKTQLVSLATTPPLIAEKFSVSSRAPPAIC